MKGGFITAFVLRTTPGSDVDENNVVNQNSKVIGNEIQAIR